PRGTPWVAWLHSKCIKPSPCIPGLEKDADVALHRPASATDPGCRGSSPIEDYLHYSAARQRGASGARLTGRGRASDYSVSLRGRLLGGLSPQSVAPPRASRGPHTAGGCCPCPRPRPTRSGSPATRRPRRSSPALPVGGGVRGGVAPDVPPRGVQPR